MELEKLKNQFKGRKFGELVIHHVKVQSIEKIIQALQGTLAELPNEIQGNEMMYFMDKLNTSVYETDFWGSDCGDKFDSIIRDARRIFNRVGVQPTNDDLFNVFNVVVLNFAYGAHKQPDMFMFIKKTSKRGLFSRLFK